MEEWRPVVGFPAYEVSSEGRVRSYNGVLSLGERDNGYLQVRLHGKTFRVNRLICEAFNGPPPFPGAVARHDPDPDRTNNHADNLKWGSNQDNSDDMVVAGRIPSGENHSRARLTWEIVREIRRRYIAGESQYQLAAAFGIHHTYCSKIVNHKNWKEPK